MNTPKIPEGYTEEEVVRIINGIAQNLAGKFRFGYHSIEDMKQQARYFAWISLSKYNGKHPLENFLWVAVRNRLCSFKRDKYQRLDKPCSKCPFNAYVNGECTKYEDLECCKFYYGWIVRNEAKKNLMETIELGNVSDECEDGMKTEVDFSGMLDLKEIISILEENIPMELYGDYHKFKNGAKMSASRKNNIRQIVLDILEENGIIDG